MYSLISQTVAHLVDCSMMSGCINHNSTSDPISIIYDPYIITLSLLKITETETNESTDIIIYTFLGLHTFPCRSLLAIKY